MKVLLIEDDLALQTTVQRTLERRGMSVSVCADALRAINRWQASLPDVVLLDLSLPQRDGLEVLREARELGLATPVLIITARGTIGDRIVGLNTGADDYLPKPFDLDELEARMRALVRRASGGAGTMANGGMGGAAPTVAGLQYEPEHGAIYHRGTLLECPPRELAMLRSLLQRPGQAVAKDKLSSAVFPGERDVQPEAIEVVAYRLRKRLAGTGVELVTLRGLGYLLKVQA